MGFFNILIEREDGGAGDRSDRIEAKKIPHQVPNLGDAERLAKNEGDAGVLHVFLANVHEASRHEDDRKPGKNSPDLARKNESIPSGHPVVRNHQVNLTSASGREKTKRLI